jgi:hypothetical protein
MFRSRTWAITVTIAISIWLIYAYLAPGLDYFGGYRDLVLGTDLASPSFPVFAPPWLATILSPFVCLPERLGFALFLAFSVAILLFSTHTLDGHPVPLLLSAQLSWILWWGQIDGLAILGLALAWIAYKEKSWILMTFALLLTLLKPQVSLIPVLILWWWMGKERWKAMLILISFGMVSILVWGPWPLWTISKMIRFAGNHPYGTMNTSLGLLALPLFIPACFIPLKNRSQRLLAITATALLVCFPLPWWLYLFTFLGYFPSLLGTEVAWKGIMLLPILTLLSIYQMPALQSLRKIFLSREISIPPQMNAFLGSSVPDESGSTD